MSWVILGLVNNKVKSCNALQHHDGFVEATRIPWRFLLGEEVPC